MCEHLNSFYSKTKIWMIISLDDGQKPKYKICANLNGVKYHCSRSTDGLHDTVWYHRSRSTDGLHDTVWYHRSRSTDGLHDTVWQLIVVVVQMGYMILSGSICYIRNILLFNIISFFECVT